MNCPSNHLEDAETVDPSNESCHDGLSSATRPNKQSMTQGLPQHTVDPDHVVQHLVKNHKGYCNGQHMIRIWLFDRHKAAGICTELVSP